MKPPNVTLDNMCIIDLEQDRKYAPQIRRLIQMHQNKEINLRVVATSASELKPDRIHSQHFNEFKQRLALVGLDNAMILPTLCRCNFSFLAYCVLGGKWQDELEKKIHTVLFAEDEIEYDGFCRKYGFDKKVDKAWNTWVNNKCDVLTLWSHIWYNGDIFVTGDKNFLEQTKKSQLIELGSGKILTQPEVVEMLDC